MGKNCESSSRHKAVILKHWQLHHKSFSPHNFSQACDDTLILPHVRQPHTCNRNSRLKLDWTVGSASWQSGVLRFVVLLCRIHVKQVRTPFWTWWTTATASSPCWPVKPPERALRHQANKNWKRRHLSPPCRCDFPHFRCSDCCRWDTIFLLTLMNHVILP